MRYRLILAMVALPSLDLDVDIWIPVALLPLVMVDIIDVVLCRLLYIAFL